MRTSAVRCFIELCRLAIVGLLLTGPPANATTYDYVGKPFTNFYYPGCFYCELFGGGSLSGFVTFNFDTSNFTGAVTLSEGDVAQFASFQFPYYLPPINVYTTVRTLSGSFTFVNGSITDWDVEGRQYQQACGLGPGCAAGSISAVITPTGDSRYVFNDNPGTDGGSSNNVGGVWIVEVPAVPEPSTWAMLLIGFAGIGFTTYRRSSRRQLPTAVM